MRLCIEDNCYKYSSFNFENEKIGIYCNNHKKEIKKNGKFALNY